MIRSLRSLLATYRKVRSVIRRSRSAGSIISFRFSEYATILSIIREDIFCLSLYYAVRMYDKRAYIPAIIYSRY